MKRDSIWAFVAGILLTSVVVTVVIWAVFPADFDTLVIPMYLFEIILWLYAYRVSRRRETPR